MEMNETLLIVTLAVLGIGALISHLCDNGGTFGDDLYN